MRNKLFYLTLVIVIAGLVMAGCEDMAPSWETSIRVPIADYSDKEDINVEEILSEYEEEGIEYDEDGYVRFKRTVDDFDRLELGAGLSEIDVASTSFDESFELEPIALDNVVSDSFTETISSNMENGSIQFDPISFDNFQSITFSTNSDNGINELNISVTAPEEFDITSLVLDISLGEEVSVEKDFDKIDNGQQATETVTLAGNTIGNELTIEVTELSTADTDPMSSGDMNLNFQIDQAEISSITEYTGDIPEESVSETIEKINFPDPEGILLKQFKLAKNSDLNININLPGNNNFDYVVDELLIGDSSFASKLEQTDNEISLDLSEEIIDISGSNTVDYTVNISKPENQGLNYEAGIVDIGGNLNLEGITSLSAEIKPEFDLMSEWGKDFELILSDIDIPDEVNDFDINDLTVDLMFNSDLFDSNDQLEIDLSGVTIDVWYDEGDNPDATIDLGDLGIDPLTVSGSNPTITLFDEGPVEDVNISAEDIQDILDLLQEQPTQIEVIPDINIDSQGEAVTVDTNSYLNMELDIDLGANITINRDIDYQVDPFSMEGSLNQGQIDQIQQGVKSMALEITDFDNQLPFDAKFDFYLGNSADKDQLYQQENYLDSLEIQKSESGESNYELSVDSDFADKLVADQVYFGVNITVQEGDIVLNKDDFINPGKISSVITVKVN